MVKFKKSFLTESKKSNLPITETDFLNFKTNKAFI